MGKGRTAHARRRLHSNSSSGASVALATRRSPSRVTSSPRDPRTRPCGSGAGPRAAPAPRRSPGTPSAASASTSGCSGAAGAAGAPGLGPSCLGPVAPLLLRASARRREVPCAPRPSPPTHGVSLPSPHPPPTPAAGRPPPPESLSLTPGLMLSPPVPHLQFLSLIHI